MTTIRYTDPVLSASVVTLMANLTIVVEDDILRRARARAAEQGTSVNALLRDELARYVDAAAGDRAAEAFLAVARGAAGRSAATGRTWTRDDLYADRA